MNWGTSVGAIALLIAIAALVLAVLAYYKLQTQSSKRGCPGPRGRRGFLGETGDTGATGVNGVAGSAVNTGATGPLGTGPTGPTGLQGLAGTAVNTGATGPTGTNGATGATGPAGATGLPGTAVNTGATGAAGSTGSFGYAEYVQTTQGSNNSIAPGSAVSYLVDHPAGVYNTLGITTLAGPGAVGTAFLLPVGFYVVDWENSNSASWSLAVYQGASNTVLTILNDTIAGSATATSWIHGRAVIQSTVGNQWIIISPVVGTAAIPVAGSSTLFVARITFLKIA